MRKPPSSEKVTKCCEVCGKEVTRCPSQMVDFHHCSRACRKRPPANITCACCGEAFTLPAYKANADRKFCSKKCHDKEQRKNPRDFECCVCGVKFTKHYSCSPAEHRFCSPECQRKATGALHARWKGGKTITVEGVELTRMKREGIVTPYIPSHRKVVQEIIGRSLGRFEPVLHIDNMKQDNRAENLFLCADMAECVRRINGSLPWPTVSNLQMLKRENPETCES